jgi:hypothetical protein
MREAVMTDARMADVTVAVNGMERDIRRYRTSPLDGDEDRMSDTALRQAVAFRKSLERWITARALRASRQDRAS